MSQISAADRVTIDAQPDRWRLIVKTEFESRVVAEANRDQPLRYVPNFASTRRLPAGGVLPVNYVHQVVLGWSQRDEAWHLGMILAPELADARGSRWCELARWPDPDRTLFFDLAQRAGQALSLVIGRPFGTIPIRSAEPAAPPPPLPSLPLRFGQWTMSEDRDGVLEIRRSRRWAASKLGRLVWYGFWAAVFLVLSVATLTKGLALPNAGTMLPNPQMLPYLGIVMGVIIAGVALANGYQFLREPDTIAVDSRTRTLQARRGSRERWHVDGVEVQSVYVTQVVGKDPRKPTVQHGELNLHRGENDFFFLLQTAQPLQPNGIRPEEAPEGEAVVEMSTEFANTDLQYAGMYLAQALGNRPCWYDQRVR